MSQKETHEFGGRHYSQPMFVMFRVDYSELDTRIQILPLEPYAFKVCCYGFALVIQDICLQP